MTTIYVIEPDGITRPMTRLRCVSEDLELQRLLEQNPDLLPGDQIDPDSPRRWIQIQREMPVPDPTSGTNRWNIDFLFGDQDAVPTLIECKRAGDRCARREIVGQMLEYAANGARYWSKDELQQYAGLTSNRRGTSLADDVNQVTEDVEMTVDEYFELMHNHLRNGRMRLVFFLEDSAFELRSIVEFLNSQTEKTEILLVEARQYEANSASIVVPRLYGFSDTARIAKRRVIDETQRKTGSKRRWDRQTFMADARARIDPKVVTNIDCIMNHATDQGYQLTWGTGKINGAVHFKLTTLCQRPILTILTNGNLIVNLRWMPSDIRSRLRDQFISATGLTIAPALMERFPEFTPSEWSEKYAGIWDILTYMTDDQFATTSSN